MVDVVLELADAVAILRSLFGPIAPRTLPTVDTVS